LNHRARRRFGQNFLIDQNVIGRIIDCVMPEPGQRIIEIGPGHGALTGPLLASGAHVMALEIDRDLARRLAVELGRPENLTVHTGDVLETDLAALAEQADYRLVGNLPYNISTPILFHVMAQRQLPRDMHFMLQREVVDRVVARPGGREYGRLSVMVQNLCEAWSLFEIAPDSFEPRPRVTSAMLRLAPRPAPIAQSEPDHFARVVKAAFAMRRKTLRNSLRGLLDEAQIRAAGVRPGSRAEQLDVIQFDALAMQSHRP
jgi:16S rRNA (adenine1518-N6/adenine1519-N6)-dimethyltransferase